MPTVTTMLPGAELTAVVPSGLLAVTPTSGEWAMVAAVVLAVALVTALAAAETAIGRVGVARARSLVDEERPGAASLAWLLRRPEEWRNTVLLVLFGALVVEATLVGVLAGRWFGPVGIAVATLVNLVVVFVGAEAAPRIWAIQRGERAALAMARPVRALVAVAPLRWAAAGLIRVTNLVLPGTGLARGPYVTEQELLDLAEVAVAEEVLDAGERDLIASILDFGDTIVREVMVPRPDMVSVPAAFRVGDVMEVVLLTGLSRLPATGDGPDDIVGLVYARDLMRAERDDRADVEVRELIRPARFVPETKRADELLREMQSDQFHLAVVVDEYGGTAGIVTLEDLIEELVGEIVDEFDREDPMVEPLRDGRARVNGRLPVNDLDALLGADLPEGDWDSVGGLLLHLLGHVPAPGEFAEVDGWTIEAERLQGRRIARVLIEPAASPTPWAAAVASPESAPQDDPPPRRGSEARPATNGPTRATSGGRRR